MFANFSDLGNYKKKRLNWKQIFQPSFCFYNFSSLLQTVGFYFKKMLSSIF